MPPGCTEAQILAVLQTHKANSTGASRTAPNRGESTTHVSSLSSYPTAQDLTKSHRAAPEGGGMRCPDPHLVQDSQVRFFSGTATLESPGVIGGRTSTCIPAVVVDPQVWATVFPGRVVRGSCRTRPRSLVGQSRSRRSTSPRPPAISPEVESAVADRLDDGAIFQVERGYQSPPG